MGKTARVVIFFLAIAFAGFALPARGAQVPDLKSSAALIIDEETGEVLYGKNVDAVVSIASITKLMTAMVVLDAGLSLEESITLTAADGKVGQSRIRSRLVVGAVLTRREVLQLALMASENPAAAALGRTYPGGMEAFVEAMNAKARALDMTDSRFAEPTGLSSENVSSAGDLAKLVRAATGYPLIADYSTLPRAEYNVRGRRTAFVNTNGLVRNSNWEIGLSKTGYIAAAGQCLVMQVKVAARSLIIVLLDSVGKLTRIGDAHRIRQWLEPGFLAPAGAIKPVARPRPPAIRPQQIATRRVGAELDPPLPH